MDIKCVTARSIFKKFLVTVKRWDNKQRQHYKCKVLQVQYTPTFGGHLLQSGTSSSSNKSESSETFIHTKQHYSKVRQISASYLLQQFDLVSSILRTIVSITFIFLGIFYEYFCQGSCLHVRYFDPRMIYDWDYISLLIIGY